jgi:RHS repeat-associated protein
VALEPGASHAIRQRCGEGQPSPHRAYSSRTNNEQQANSNHVLEATMFRNQKLQRAIASVLLISFTTGLFAPLAAAAQAPAIMVGTTPLIPLKAASSSAMPALDANGIPTGKGVKQASRTAIAAPVQAISPHGYSDAIGYLHELTRESLADLAAGRGDALALANAMRAQYASVLKQESEMAASFKTTEAYLRAHGVPAEIVQRHQAMVSEFATRSRGLRSAMAALDAAAAGKGAPQAALSQLAQWLEQFPSQSGQHGHGKDSLPWGKAKPKALKVALTPRQHELRFPRSVQLAAAGSLSGISLPDAMLPNEVQPADLAATDDAPATPEILALAASLGNNPVAIHNWVRNQIRYTPGYGAMQGGAATLQARRGNDVDTASLLIALYRAAGIPARYVYGTIEAPAARLNNWLGVDNTPAALALMTQAGIPNRSVGDSVQLEHMWVEAFVDYSPSRGAVNKGGTTWSALDPSFKQMDKQAGMDLRAAVNLNEAGLFDAVKQGATCTVDYARNLNVGNLQQGYGSYKDSLGTYLTQQGADLTVGQVLGSAAIAPENYSILLGTLPYKTVAQGAIANVLPDQLRWKFRLQLYAGATEQGLDQSTAGLTASLAAVAGKRLTLSFAPATQADADTLAAYLPAAHADNSPVLQGEFPAEIPGYLIRVKAEVRLAGEVVASGGSFVLGSELVADIGAFDPAAGSWNDTTFYPHAGDYHAVAIDAQGLGAGELNALKARLNSVQAKLSAGEGGSLRRDEVSGELLYQAALSYFATADANGAVFQRAAGVVEQRLPSYGRAVAQVQPQMVLGIVNNVSFPGVVLDIDRASSAVASQAKGLDSVAYVRQANERNAAYAHQVLARLFTGAQQPGQAVSPIRSIASAAATGQIVYGVTSANSASVLPLVSLTASAAGDLQNAVAAGYSALVAQAPLAVGGWSGQGIVTEDPASGGGSFRLSGEAGSATAALYLDGGMGWLALPEPAQSAAALAPVAQAGQAIDATLAALLDEASNTTRWSFFPGQAEVVNGLFLARLTAAQGAQPCDSVAGILAANMTTTAGFDSGSVAGAPVIVSAPVISAGAGQAYHYAVIASDPQGGALAYSLAAAPTGMTISDTGIIDWAKPVTGSYSITVRADNGKTYAEQRYQVTVGEQALSLAATLVATPSVVNLGDSVGIDFVTNGGTGNIALTLSVDGQPVALDTRGHAVVTASATGAHQINASATDAIDTVTRSATYSVRDLADTTVPVALIASPVDDAEVTAPVNVIGTASATSLAYYQLLLRPAGDTAWTEIARGTSSVSNGVLGKLDPTQLANGIYEMVLMVADANGNKQSSFRTLDIYRDLKIGQFAITFEDLNVEAAGIPIRVTRTYDTRKKSENLDFGYGWTVDYQSVQVRKNMVLGLQWNVEVRQFLLCLVPVGKRKINITLPDGKVQRYTAANAQECAFGTIPDVDIKLSPLPGTTSQLEIVNIPSLMAQGGQLYDADNFESWNPKQFKLTTEDNYVYYLTEGIGITQVRDPSGNTLTYGQNGIVHSNGQSIAFTRDAAKRITAITDPSGKRIRYTYSAAGDLVSVTNRSDAISKFNYNRSHGLTDYTDPMGIVTARYVYDDEGRLTAAYDADGKAVEATHDTANNREIVKDRRGNVTTYVYDSAGNVTESVDALNNKTTYNYDALGNVISTTDANGKTTASTFDPKSGKQLSEVDPLGGTSAWAYDLATGTQLQNMTDARNNVTYFMYAGNGSQTVTEPLGRSTSIGIGADGNMSSLNLAGRVSNYTYDSKGNKTSETDAAGKVITYGYDANGKETSRSWIRTVNGVPQTVSMTRKLDAEGRVLEETDELGYVSKTAYNAGGQVTSTTDPQGRTTGYEYSPRGKLTKITYADNSSESFEYDPENNKISATDRQGRITRFEYDPLNRLTRTIYPDGSDAGTEYDAVGRVSATLDSNKKRTVNTYDDAGRLLTVTDPELKVTRFGYDANGNRTSVTDANQNVTQYQYDALNRLVLTTAPHGKTASIVWNVNGTKSSETDFGGNSTSYGYDPMGRLNQVTQTNGATAQNTVYQYDILGNKTSQTDAEGRTTRWTYDAANRVTSRVLPDGRTERFAYDETGKLTSKTDFANQTTRYSYTSTGQLNQVIRPDGATIVTIYTPSGQVDSTTVTGGSLQNGKTSYSYDAQDRLVRQTNPGGSFLAYGYDANGNIQQRSTAAGTVTYAYDGNQRLIAVTGIDGKVTRYTYDPTGKLLTESMPNGVTASHRYDANGRLLELLHVRGDGSIVTGVRYTLKANGQRASVQEFDGLSTLVAAVAGNPAHSIGYTYDAIGRLTLEDVATRDGTAARTTAYAYDGVGNRTLKTETSQAGTATTTYVYDSCDRLTQESKSTVTGSVVLTVYAWDLNGNLKSKSTGSDTVFYTWDSDNRLIEAKQGTSEATALTLVRYTYDPNGNRVASTAPGQDGTATVTNYLVDASFPYSQVVQQDIAKGAVVESTSYVRGLDLIQQVRSGQSSFYHADGLGSVKAVTGVAGDLSNAYTYDAFGAAENNTGKVTSDYRYTGEFFDDLIGLQFNRARWYDALNGRFVSQDSFSGAPTKPTTLNKYVYANSDAVNETDPNGRFGLMDVSAANDIAGTLNSVQINFGYDFASNALDGDSDNSSSNGWAALASLAPFAIGQIAKKSIKIVSIIGSKGKVAYSAKKIPLDKEIEAAGFLSERLGVGIYIRGGASTQGADFFISGVKWELKTLESATNESVKNNIKKALKQSSRVVIDGRTVGLTEVDALRGVARAFGVGNVPDELMIILKDGKILTWP